MEALDLPKAQPVVNRVGELQAGRVARHANASLVERFHAADHVREDMLHTGAGAGFFAVADPLLVGQRIPAGAFFAIQGSTFFAASAAAMAALW